MVFNVKNANMDIKEWLIGDFVKSPFQLLTVLNFFKQIISCVLIAMKDIT